MRRGWAGLTDKALMLSKCVMRRMWGSQTPLRQFKGIPYEILSKVGTPACLLPSRARPTSRMKHPLRGRQGAVQQAPGGRPCK